MEAVGFPDVEGACMTFLRTELATRGDTAKVGDKVPDGHGRFVRVQRSGGSRSLAHDAAQVIFECWDETPADAHDLGAMVRALVGSMDTPTAWFSSEIGGLAFFPDPRTDLPRYQFTALIRTRGKAI